MSMPSNFCLIEEDPKSAQKTLDLLCRASEYSKKSKSSSRRYRSLKVKPNLNIQCKIRTKKEVKLRVFDLHLMGLARFKRQSD
jgi:hypothetical protein